MGRFVFPLLSVLAGGLAALGFAPWDLWPLTLLGAVALAWLVIAAPGPGAAALRGWLWGVGHFALGLNWIAHAFTFQAKMPAALGGVAVLGLAMFLALYPALAAGLARLGRGRAAQLLLLAGLFAGLEWARGVVLTGFPWNPLAAAWLSLTGPSQWLAVLGSHGVTLLTMVLAAGLLLLALGQGRERLAGAGLASLVIGIAATGSLMLGTGGLIGAPLLVVQPNIGQDQRYTPAFEAAALTQYKALTAQGMARLAAISTAMTDAEPAAAPAAGAADNAPGAVAADGALPAPAATDGSQPPLDAGIAGPDADRSATANGNVLSRLGAIILWPEGAVLNPVENNPALRRELASVLRPGDVLLFGGTGLSGRGYANSLFALDAQGRILGRYDKAHLVPLGEYVPARSLLEPLGLARLVPGDADFVPGPGPRLINLPGVAPVGPIVCYEIIFPGAVVAPGQRPGWIANVSNDAWYGADGPPQHLAQARLRAIEEGLPVVRATPTGISAIIDPWGRVISAIAPGQADVLVNVLPAPAPETVFGRYGNAIALLLSALVIALGLALPRIGFRT
jgi:apolipoprotein N-acyltransferase